VQGLFGMRRGFSFGKDKKEGKGGASAGEEIASSGYTTDEGSIEERNRSRVSLDVVGDVTMGTTNVERTGGVVDDSPQNYSNTPSTPVGMRDSLVMPVVDFTQVGTWASNSPAASATPEALSSSVGSLEGQSPVDNAQMEGGYIFRPLSTVMEVPSASPTPAPQLPPQMPPKREEKSVPATIPEEAAPIPEPTPAAEASEAEEYSHSDNDEEQSPAGSSTHLTPPATLRKKLSARSLKTLKKKQAAERRRREEEEAHERERRGSVTSLQDTDNRSRQGSEASILAAGNKQTMSTPAEGE